jgi:phosphatidylserine/phosphatidylglycerophosphate/cardiolipin synthase-like enzyme
MQAHIEIMIYIKYLALLLFCKMCFATQVYFSDQHDVISKLEQLIHKEKKEIRIVMYTFTHNGIMRALIDAKKRGVEITLLVDPYSVRVAKAKIDKLKKNGIQVYVFDPKTSHRPSWYRIESICHHKFLLFSSLCKVWTGSFNATYGAAVANLENVVVLETKELFSQFLNYYNKIFNKHFNKLE